MLAIRVGILLTLATLGVGYALLGRQDKLSAPAAQPASLAASVYESFAVESRDAPFARLSGPWTLSLPDDHGGHDAARVETWTVVAHLDADEGRSLGLQLSIARLGLSPPDAATYLPSMAVTAIYRAHVIVTDAAGDAIHAEERLSRGLGAAGHDLTAGEVWHDDWLFTYGTAAPGLGLTLGFREVDLPIALRLVPTKPADPLTEDQGVRGFAIPRLSVEGAIGDTRVRGTAMFTHLWGDVPLPGGAVGTDVLALQLDDGSDVILIRTFRRDGKGEAVLDGLLSDGNADILTLRDDEVDMSPLTGNGEDGGWRISGSGLALKAVPLLAKHHESFAFPLSTGLLRVTGTRDDMPVEGLGTLQRTGGAH